MLRSQNHTVGCGNANCRRASYDHGANRIGNGKGILVMEVFTLDRQYTLIQQLQLIV
ncbi:MAG: hypothetical protein ACJAU3_001555 [Zhongshania sp.]